MADDNQCMDNAEAAAQDALNAAEDALAGAAEGVVADVAAVPENAAAANSAFADAAAEGTEALQTASAAQAETDAAQSSPLDQLATMLAGEDAPATTPLTPAEPTATQPFSDPNVRAEAAHPDLAAPTQQSSMTPAQQQAYQQAYAQQQQAFQQTYGIQPDQAVYDPAAQQATMQQGADAQPLAAQQAATQQAAYNPAAQQAAAQQTYAQQPYAQQGYAQQAGAQQPYAGQQPYTQPQYVQPQYVQPGPNPGTTPMVLGILSIVFAGLVGLVLSILAIRKSGEVTRTYGENSRAKAGKITGIVGLILSILGMLVGLAVIAGSVFLAANYDEEELTSMIEDYMVEEGYSSSDIDAILGGANIGTSSESAEADAQASSSAAGSSAASGSYVPDSAEETLALAAVEKSLAAVKDPKSDIRKEIVLEMEDIFDDGQTGLQDLGITGEEFAGWLLDDLTYTVKDATLFDTGDGWVDAQVKSRDFNSFYDKLDELVFSFNDEGGFNDMNTADVNSKMGEFFRQAMEQTDQVEKTVMFDVQKKSGTWQIDEESLWYALDSILFGY